MNLLNLSSSLLCHFLAGCRTDRVTVIIQLLFECSEPTAPEPPTTKIRYCFITLLSCSVEIAMPNT
jgi:hypothetical protein